MRLVRWLQPGTVWLITNRCERETFLLEPSEKVNELVGGWLARALERYGDGIEVYGFSFMSNHFHILLRDNKGQLPKVMWYFQTNLAKEVNRVLGRPTGRVFGRRYDTKQIEDELPFLGRLAYVLCNPVKHGLVKRASHWHGLSSLDASLSGEPMRFRLLDRTALHNALRGGKPVKREDFVRTHTIRLAVPPMLAESSDDEQREMVADLVAAFEEGRLGKTEADDGERARRRSARRTDRPRAPSFQRRRAVVAETAEREAEVMDAWKWTTNSYHECFDGFRRAARRGRRFHGEWPPWTCPPGCLEPVGC